MSLPSLLCSNSFLLCKNCSKSKFSNVSGLSSKPKFPGISRLSGCSGWRFSKFYNLKDICVLYDLHNLRLQGLLQHHSIPIVNIVAHNRSYYLHCGHFAHLVQIQACLVGFDESRQRWIWVLALLSALDGIVKHA